MSVSTPIFTTPSEALVAAPAVAPTWAIRAAQISALSSFRFIASSSLSCWKLDAEVLMQLADPGRKVLLLHHLHDPPVLHHVVPVCQLRGKTEILFHHNDRETFLLQSPDDPAEGLHDDGGQPFRDLVQQKQTGPGAQDPGHREHLL